MGPLARGYCGTVESFANGTPMEKVLEALYRDGAVPRAWRSTTFPASSSRSRTRCSPEIGNTNCLWPRTDTPAAPVRYSDRPADGVLVAADRRLWRKRLADSGNELGSENSPPKIYIYIERTGWICWFLVLGCVVAQCHFSERDGAFPLVGRNASIVVAMERMLHHAVVRTIVVPSSERCVALTLVSSIPLELSSKSSGLSS
jgi:hypothetical protein